MANPLLDEILARSRALKAQVHARIGPPINPEAEVLRYLGFKVLPGERLIDTVSGLEVEVVGATVKNVNPASPGIKAHPDRLRSLAE